MLAAEDSFVNLDGGCGSVGRGHLNYRREANVEQRIRGGKPPGTSGGIIGGTYMRTLPR